VTRHRTHSNLHQIFIIQTGQYGHAQQLRPFFNAPHLLESIRAAAIIVKPPPVCSVSIETPNAAAASTAFVTVVGMS